VADSTAPFGIKWSDFDGGAGGGGQGWLLDFALTLDIGLHGGYEQHTITLDVTTVDPALLS